jgi:putative FmdB family regulatory protein
MPLYEYRCSRCSQTFEVMQKFSDTPLAVHEGCGGPVERLLSPPALQFKGSGWYVTDYGRNGSSASSNGSEKADGKGTAKPEAKAEGKSDTTSTAKPAATDKSGSS